MNMFTNVLLLSCLALVRVLSALPMPEISSSVERFYNENLERHVKHIAEQIVAHNVHVQQQKHPHAHQHHHHGHVRAKHERHPHGSTAAAAASQASEEEMQSDQPMPGSQGHTTGNAHQLRLAQGQQKIEDRDRIAMENMIKHRLIMFVNGSNSYGERDRSFYANCDQPKGTDENDDLMKLHFTLSQLEDNIAAANLRLHRKHIAKQTPANIDSNGDALPCNQDAEKLYRVTVYHHAKGARKHKLERKIVESCVISESMAFVNLNVLHGVRELNKGKFFGVAIQIEDQFGGIVKASDFFNGPTCTRLPKHCQHGSKKIMQQVLEELRTQPTLSVSPCSQN